MTGRSPAGRAGRPTDQAPAGLGDAATIPNAVVVPSALGLFLLAEFAMLGFVVGVWVSQ